MHARRCWRITTGCSVLVSMRRNRYWRDISITTRRPLPRRWHSSSSWPWRCQLSMYPQWQTVWPPCTRCGRSVRRHVRQAKAGRVKALFWGLLLALAASTLALLGTTVGGNVVFLVPPYRIDLSLFFFLLLAAAAAVALYWLAWALIRIGDFPTRVALYRKRRAEIGSQRALRGPLRTLLEGRFARAEPAAPAAQGAPENAGLAALPGARAPARRQQPLRRDAWLDQADADPALATATLVSGAGMWAGWRDKRPAR